MAPLSLTYPDYHEPLLAVGIESCRMLYIVPVVQTAMMKIMAFLIHPATFNVYLLLLAHFHLLDLPSISYSLTFSAPTTLTPTSYNTLTPCVVTFPP